MFFNSKNLSLCEHMPSEKESMQKEIKVKFICISQETGPISCLYIRQWSKYGAESLDTGVVEETSLSTGWCFLKHNRLSLRHNMKSLCCPKALLDSLPLRWVLTEPCHHRSYHFTGAMIGGKHSAKDATKWLKPTLSPALQAMVSAH